MRAAVLDTLMRDAEVAARVADAALALARQCE
jgi:hypothetical protein